MCVFMCGVAFVESQGLIDDDASLTRIDPSLPKSLTRTYGFGRVGPRRLVSRAWHPNKQGPQLGSAVSSYGKSEAFANWNAPSTNPGGKDKDSLGLNPAADSQGGMFNDDLDDSGTREWPHEHMSYSDFSKAVDSETIGSHPKGY